MRTVIQIALVVVTITAFGYLVAALSACSSRTVDQDLTICKSICADRYVNRFDRRGDDGQFACECGAKQKPDPAPCADAGTRP